MTNSASRDVLVPGGVVSTVRTVPPETFSPDPTALDRTVEFELAFNVRDLGGLPTGDGRSIRRGLVYRADGVHRLAGDDLEKARTLSLRTVVDLRTGGEIERSGRFPVEGYPVEWHHLPIMERMWSEDDLVATTGAVDFLCDRYVDMLRSGGPSIRRIITLAADGTPMLFHCAAGKDRTGVVAAVLLALAGVPSAEIAADYHATAGAMAAFVDWLTVTHPEAIDAMTSQPPEYLEAPHEAMLKLLERVDEHHGSMEGYVTELGVDAATLERLRTTLIQPLTP